MSNSRSAAALLAQTWLLTGLVDGAFSSVLAVAFYGSSVARLFQGVASTVLGQKALTGGTNTAAIGILMHFGVALAWSVLFLVLLTQSSWLREVLVRRGGVIKVAAVYGPLVWLVMSLVVIPFLVHRPPSITIRWWVQLIGHFPFVGLPIVASLSRAVPAIALAAR